MRKRVSIVMTYYERFRHLRNTLRTFLLHGYDPAEVEVIVVDDGSQAEPLESDFVRTLPYPITVIRMPTDKSYSNPCIPFNKGFSAASGEVVLIQNAECMHVDNIVRHATEQLTASDYFSYSCYSLDQQNTVSLFDNPNWALQNLRGLMTNNGQAVLDGQNAWYNHSVVRPKGFHFCSAISRENLDILNGFDSRYSSGIAFDDNEILIRIRRMGLKVRIVDEASVIHQWHYAAPRVPGYKKKFARNGLLYQLVTRTEGGFVGGQQSWQYSAFRILYPVLVPAYNLILTLKRRAGQRAANRRIT